MYLGLHVLVTSSLELETRLVGNHLISVIFLAILYDEDASAVEKMDK